MNWPLKSFWKDIQRTSQREALKATRGAWKHEHHPELAAGPAEYVEQLVQRLTNESGRLIGDDPFDTSVMLDHLNDLRSGEEAKTRELFSLLQSFQVKAKVAQRAGLLRRDWLRRGHALSVIDVTIAAVALSYESISPYQKWKALSSAAVEPVTFANVISFRRQIRFRGREPPHSRGRGSE